MTVMGHFDRMLNPSEPQTGFGYQIDPLWAMRWARCGTYVPSRPKEIQTRKRSMAARAARADRRSRYGPNKKGVRMILAGVNPAESLTCTES